MASSDGVPFADEGWWNLVDRHIENLIPGIATLVPLLAVAHERVGVFKATLEDPIVKLLNEHAYVGPLCFLAIGYLVGVLSFTVGRLALDPVCRWTARPLLFRITGSLTSDEAYNSVSTAPCWRSIVDAVDETYRKKVGDILMKGDGAVKQEVGKRRQRGRLIRGALIPAILITFILTADFWGVWGQGSAIAALYVGFLFVLAHVELSIFQEALLGVNGADAQQTGTGTNEGAA